LQERNEREKKMDRKKDFKTTMNVVKKVETEKLKKKKFQNR